MSLNIVFSHLEHVGSNNTIKAKSQEQEITKTTRNMEGHLSFIHTAFSYYANKVLTKQKNSIL